MSTPPPSETPTDSSTTVTRDRIIDAGIAEFTTHGYARTTTRRLAEAAGVNEVTIFRHFGSKKKLLLACVDAINATGFAATFAAHVSGDYAADIAVMARRQIDDTVARFAGLRLLLCEALSIPEVRASLIHGAGDNSAHLTAYFASQIAAGVIRADLTPTDLVNAFNGIFSANVFFSTLLDATPPDDATVQQLAQIFVAGTIAPQGATP